MLLLQTEQFLEPDKDDNKGNSKYATSTIGKEVFQALAVERNALVL